jgi:hypothetical protein
MGRKPGSCTQRIIERVCHARDLLPIHLRLHRPASIDRIGTRLALIIQPIANELRHDTDVSTHCQQSRLHFLLGGGPPQSTPVLERGHVTCRQAWPLWRSLYGRRRRVRRLLQGGRWGVAFSGSNDLRPTWQ